MMETINGIRLFSSSSESKQIDEIRLSEKQFVYSFGLLKAWQGYQSMPLTTIPYFFLSIFSILFFFKCENIKKKYIPKNFVKHIFL